MPDSKELLDLFLDFEDIYFRNRNHLRIGIVKKKKRQKHTKKNKEKRKKSPIKTRKKINSLDLSYI